MNNDIRAEIVTLIPRLRRFSFSLCGSPHDADDLVQGGIEKALNNLASFKPGTRLDSWLFRIIQNLWIDQLRSGKHQGVTVNLDEVAMMPGEDGRQTTETELMLGKTRQAILQLPADQRSLVALVLVEGYAYQEAAAILEIPLGTVMSRLARARKTLAQQLQPGDN